MLFELHHGESANLFLTPGPTTDLCGGALVARAGSDSIPDPSAIADVGPTSVVVTLGRDTYDQCTVGREVTVPWSDWTSLLIDHERRPDKAEPLPGGRDWLVYTLARFAARPCTCGDAPTATERGCPDYGHVPGAPHLGHRIADNVIEVTALGVDLDKDADGHPLTADAASAILADYRAKRNPVGNLPVSQPHARGAEVPGSGRAIATGTAPPTGIGFVQRPSCT